MENISRQSLPKTPLERFHYGTVIPAIPLALTESRAFDPAAQRRLIRYYLEAGAGGIAAAVHTTQFRIHDDPEQWLQPLLSLTMEEMLTYQNETETPIVKICGVCGNTRQAVSEARMAREMGFDLALLANYGVQDRSEPALLDRMSAVAEEIPVVAFYMQEAVGGIRLSADFWSSVCAIPQVKGIKCAPFDRYRTLELVRACALSPRADEIALYTGNDDNIVPDLLTNFRFQREDGSTAEKRFVGGLLGHWSVWTKAVCDLYDSLRHGTRNAVELLTIGAQITDANAAIFDAAGGFSGCIPGVHEVLRRQGLLETNLCLDPQETLSPGQAQALDKIRTIYPALNDDAFVKEFLVRYEERRKNQGTAASGC